MKFWFDFLGVAFGIVFFLALMAFILWVFALFAEKFMAIVKRGASASEAVADVEEVGFNDVFDGGFGVSDSPGRAGSPDQGVDVVPDFLDTSDDRR